HGLEVAIARPHRPREPRQCRVGLDSHAVPAPEIEQERAVVVDRMPGPDIDIEPIAALAEAAQKVKILETLGVGDDPVRHHRQPRSLKNSLGPAYPQGDPLRSCVIIRACRAAPPRGVRAYLS